MREIIRMLNEINRLRVGIYSNKDSSWQTRSVCNSPPTFRDYKTFHTARFYELISATTKCLLHATRLSRFIKQQTKVCHRNLFFFLFLMSIFLYPISNSILYYIFYVPFYNSTFLADMVNLYFRCSKCCNRWRKNLSLSERLLKSGRVQVIRKQDSNNAVCGIETMWG